MGAEDIAHLLFRCPKAQEIWMHLGLSDIIEDAMNTDRAGSAVLEHILKENDLLVPGYDHIKVKELISVACWYLWWMRRRRTHNEEVPPLFKCIHSILSITSNAAAVGKKGLHSNKVWTKPEPRQIKLNVDASFNEEIHAGAVAAVLRDYQGTFVGAKCVLIPHVSSPATAEAIAMKEGLLLAISMGCNTIIAESDAIEVIEACTGKEIWWNEAASIFADIVDSTTTIGEVTFKHCPREANNVAHELAKFSFLNKNSCNWASEPPSFLLNSLISDVTIH
jgi:ribonuclease HI